jgi:DUF1009 family protein
MIAGAGELPVLFARQAKGRGMAVKTAAVRGAASPLLEKLSDEITWISLGQLGSLISFFKKEGVRRAVMHGKVQHAQLFKNLRLDWKAISVWARLRDRSGEALLKAVALELKKAGITLLDSRYLMNDFLSQRGWLVPMKNDPELPKTVAYGLKQARGLAKLGIGQTLVVKRNAVAAVEAMEGTNQAILRAGRWAGPGSIVVKVASPRQDWRFDVPTIGPQTLQSLAKAKARGIVIEAGRTFLLNKAKTTGLAKQNGIFILSV